MKLVYEKRTNKSLNDAIESLEENLKKHSFGVLWKFNIKDKIQGKGLEFKEDYVILEVCNPSIAKDVLDRNIHVGYVLPCKMVVRTEKEKTYMGMSSPEVLIGLFDHPELGSFAKKVDQALRDSIESSL